MHNPVLDFMLSPGFWLSMAKILAPVLIWLALFFLASALGVFRRPALAQWKWAIFIGGLTLSFTQVVAP